MNMLPKTVISSTQILTRRSQSALGLEYCQWAAKNGHLHILEYLVERKFDEYSELACEYAATYGHLDCLKYLHETAKAPWDLWPFRAHRTTTPNVYNTSSTTTVHYQMVGDTKMESYTAWNQNQNQNKT